MKNTPENRDSVRRVLARGVIGLLLSGPIVVGIATPASAGERTDAAPAREIGVSAYPSDCWYSVTNSYGARASCEHHNGGSYRAIALCRHTNGTLRDYYGFWTQGGWSQAYCQGDSKVSSAGIEYSSINRS